MSLNMSCKRGYLHPQVLQEIILQKRKQVAELQEEYEQFEISTSATPIESLNSHYLALQAENRVLKNSNPNVIPRCKTLLFAWTHQKLQADVRNLEELLSYQRSMKEISFEKELELRKISQGSLQLSTKFDCEEEKENESLRSEILLCLHQRLIRRLRRITREYFPAISDTEHQTDGDVLKQNKKENLFSILQALFPDLKDTTLQPNEWGKVEGVHIKDSYPEEYVELLISSKIVDFDEEKPNFMKIIAG